MESPVAQVTGPVEVVLGVESVGANLWRDWRRNAAWLILLGLVERCLENDAWQCCRSVGRGSQCGTVG